MNAGTRTRALIVFPTHWDRKQLDACRTAWEGDCEVELAEPDDFSCPSDFDVVGYVERLCAERRGRLDGVFSTSDHPGATVAAAIATRLGLPGSRPADILRASHKWASRLVQREAAPEVTPGVQLVDPRRPETIEALELPRFLKPVKGAFSVMSGRVDTLAEARAFFARPSAREFLEWFPLMFDALRTAYSDIDVDGGHFLAEEVVKGTLFTVEGFSVGDDPRILGLVDSVVDPRSSSFLRFDHPSSLPPDAQSRAEDAALRIVRALRLRWTGWNVEMIHDAESGAVHVIEVNPRPCGQFSDLYLRVHGTSGHAIALSLALGREPPLVRDAGPHACASSRPLRTFQPVRVRSAPDAARVAAVEEALPGVLCWVECATGDVLDDFETIEDGHSARYGVVNAGGASRQDVDRRLDEAVERLGFELEPVAPRPSGA